MLLGLGNEEDHGNVAGHLKKLVSHAEGAIRCYLTLLAAEVERRWQRLLHDGLWSAATVGLGLIGIGLFASGAARYLEVQVAVPGGGAMIVGLGLALIALALVLARRRKGEG